MPSEKEIKQLLGPESFEFYRHWTKKEGLYACPTCGEPVRHYGQRCKSCAESIENDRLERESGR